MSNGKGDKRRPCNQARYDRNYIAIFGKDCWFCNGSGKVWKITSHMAKMDSSKTWQSKKEIDCPDCDGIGRVDKHARK